MKIAIVGAEESKWNEEQKKKAKQKIKEILLNHWVTYDIFGQFEPELEPILVSGGCPKRGVDIWAEEYADRHGIKKEIYRPEVHQWNDLPHAPIPKKGLNLEFTHQCSRCRAYWDGKIWSWDLAPATNVCKLGYRSRNIQIAEACDVLYCINPIGVWSGGEWTRIWAKKLGKKTFLVEIK